MPRALLSALLVVVPTLTFGGCATDIADRVTRAAQRGAEDAASSEAYNRTRRAVSGAVECVAGDRDCSERAEREGRDVVLVDDQGRRLPDSRQPGAPSAGRSGAANANFDFTPGTRVLFADDFSRDNLGDFPRRLEFKNGSMEVVDLDGRRALRAKTKGAFDIVLPETLPDQFTVEFDYYGVEFVNDLYLAVVDAEGEMAGPNYVAVDAYSGVGVAAKRNSGASSSLQPDRRLDDQTLPIRVMVDGSYAKVFVGEERVANVPNADFGRTNRIRFVFDDVRKNPIYVSSLRVAAGGRDLYDQLRSDGALTLGGVEFETGSARLRGSSTATLAEVADMLRQHGDLRLRVEGHTDNTGSAAGNDRLSQQRAEAVRAFLVERGVSADRLVAVGLGAARPVADNGTEAGRQQNRRVVLTPM